MLELPKQIKIGILTYTVDTPISIERKSDGAYLFGYISHEEQSIDVRECLSPNLKAVALLHEIIHGIFFQTGHFFDDPDEERICVALSHAFVALLRDNPDLVSYIIDGKPSAPPP